MSAHQAVAAAMRPRISFLRFVLFSIIINCFVVLAGATVSASAATITVAAGGNFQAALNSAQPGDTIILEAGASYKGPFTLPNKPGAEWITIRGSAAGENLPAAGQRMTPEYAPLLPKLITPGSNEPALKTARGAHHYRFVGIEFAPINSSVVVSGLIKLGDDEGDQKSLEDVPHHIAFERCYMHGLPGAALKRGVALNSAHTDIVDSYLSEFKAKGQDAQAVCGWNGPGPFKLINNYLEGSGENVMFGGANPGIQGLVPSDIEIRGNHFAKPLEWRGVWTVKNLLEIKFARRMVIDGNLFEYNWSDAQTGFAILFKVSNPGRAPWVSTEDIQFTNNIVRHAGGGVSILGRDYRNPSGVVKRVQVANNLFSDIGGQWGAGRFLSITEGADDVVFDHNTILQSGSLIIADSDKVNNRFVWTNNLAPHNKYGVTGNGTGNSTLNTFFPGVTFRQNVLAGGRASSYPAGNYFPATLDQVKFVNHSAGDYRLAESSPYKFLGTDGKDIGCDLETLKTAMSGQLPKSDSAPAPKPQATPTPAPQQPTSAQGATVHALLSAALTKVTNLAKSSKPSRGTIEAVAQEVQQAHAVFINESGKLGNVAKADGELRAAYFFLRAAAVLAETKLPVASVQKRIQIAAVYLEKAKASVAGLAYQSGSVPEDALPLGIADARSSASMAPALSPLSLGVILGSADLSPFTEQSAGIGATGSADYEMGGVSVLIGGRPALISYASANRISFLVPEDVAQGEVEVITTSQDGYVASGVATIATTSPAVFTSLSNEASEAVVLNGQTLQSGPFEALTAEASGQRRNTRLMFFTTGISHAAPNTNPDNDVRLGTRVLANFAESVAVEARTANGQVMRLTVEYAGPQGTYPGLDQVNVVVPQELKGSDRIELTLIVGEQRSNAAVVAFKHA